MGLAGGLVARFVDRPADTSYRRDSGWVKEGRHKNPASGSLPGLSPSFSVLICCCEGAISDRPQMLQKRGPAGVKIIGGAFCAPPTGEVEEWAKPRSRCIRGANLSVSGAPGSPKRSEEEGRDARNKGGRGLPEPGERPLGAPAEPSRLLQATMACYCRLVSRPDKTVLTRTRQRYLLFDVDCCCDAPVQRCRLCPRLLPFGDVDCAFVRSRS